MDNKLKCVKSCEIVLGATKHKNRLKKSFFIKKNWIQFMEVKKYLLELEATVKNGGGPGRGCAKPLQQQHHAWLPGRKKL